METRISTNADELRDCSKGEALAAVDELLGAAERWEPSLIAYRLRSAFQADWKTEVGCWLRFAKTHGFLAQLMHRLQRALHEAAAPEVTGANDKAHRILMQELTPAMTAYYFTRSGWDFVEWEPAASEGDIDLRLRCPFGALSDIQVKAPDQPGERAGGQIVDGEHDDWVIAMTDKALKQLRLAPGPQRLAVIYAQRDWAPPANLFLGHLIGSTVGRASGVTLREKDRGAFAREPGIQVGAVLHLSLTRGVDDLLYRCTVFMNPWAQESARPAVAAFRNARICHMVDDTFTWEPEQPNMAEYLPIGTRYIRTGSH
ncbi:MAG: hypothetical protein ABI895_37615 [Deltaproteobacteria bacterium]